MTVGAGGGVTTEGMAIGAGLLTGLVEFYEAVTVLIVLLLETAALLFAEGEETPELMTVVVVEVLTLPFTHLPLLKISPNLEEQVLQPTPPSLKVKAYVSASQDATQLPPLTTCLFPHAAHTLPGSTPTATYTSENSSSWEEAETVSTKPLSMVDAKLRA